MGVVMLDGKGEISWSSANFAEFGSKISYYKIIIP